MENTADDKNTAQDTGENEAPPVIDAIVHVSITENQLEAYINIEPPSIDGAPPTLEMIQAALADCELSHKVDVEKLKAIEEEPVYSQDILIARGVAPVNGVDGTVSFLFETQKKGYKPKEKEDGSVDFHDLGIVENVAEGQVLCIITPPTEGAPGFTVRGKELLQKKGKPVPSCAGKNTVFNEDGTALLSKISGQVEFDGRKIHVYETFYVTGNVDNSTGDIQVACNLDVVGMVLPGFKIEAGNNISVKGTVENTTVKAGGNIDLMSGITASEIYCEGDLKCRFIENCTVLVKGEITAEYILNSNIKCGKSVKTVGRRAKIIGGSCLAGQNIETNTIGSIANVKTKLELGTDYTVIERQQELLAKIPELEKAIESLKPLVTLLHQLEESNRLTAEKKQILDKALYSYEINVKMHEESTKELEEIIQLVNSRGYGRILCTGTIYPGTTVVIGPTTLSLNETLTNTSLYYNEGNIYQGVARR